VGGDAAGTLIAVWQTNRLLGGEDDDDWDLVFVRSTDAGETWAAALPLQSNALTDTGDDWAPDIATDGAGTWIVAWYSNEPLGEKGDGPDRDILYVRSTDNGLNWSDPAPVHSNALVDNGWDSTPHVATDGQTWIVSWYTDDRLDDVGMDLGTDRDIVLVRSTDGGATWTDPQPLNSDAEVDLGDDFVEHLASDGRGGWLAVWYSENDPLGVWGTDFDIRVARSADAGATWTEPAGLNSHAAFDETWDSLPQLATDGAGTWACAWQSEDSVGGLYENDIDVLFAISTDDGLTWTATEAVNTTAAEDEAVDFGPTLISGSPGRFFVVWLSDNSLGDTIGDDFDLLAAHLAVEDCNSNEVPDACDIAGGAPDCSGDGVPDDCEPDCNGNKVADSCDLTSGLSQDCDGDTVPDDCQDTSADCNANGAWDACDVAGGASLDCNGNLAPDECDLSTGSSPDCNGNQVPDECDVVVAFSPDCNENVVPDECEPGGTADCNDSDQPDLCDIYGGASQDCNTNHVPDECDIAAGHSADCAGEGVPDECEPDCNANQTPDSCDIFSGSSEDCDHDTVPDDCQDTSADCNSSGEWDPCDIDSGFSADCDHNLVPDECQDTSADCNDSGLWDPCDIDAGASEDCNDNLVPDECDAVAPSIRLFMAPDGQELEVQRYCNTVVHMDPGTSITVMIWMEDNLQLTELTAIQPMVEWRGRPRPGAVGTVEYVDFDFMGCGEPPEDFGLPCDPKDPQACGGHPEVCSIMDGATVFTDESREDYVFFGDITAGPAYHERPPDPKFDVAVFGILALREPLTEGIFVDGTHYLGEFSMQASPDASGEFELKYNTVSTFPPTPLNTLFAPGGLIYPVMELQNLTIVVGDIRPVGSDPPDGAVDARRPSHLDGSDQAGWDRVVVHFDRDAAAVVAGDFTIQVSGGVAPVIESISHDGRDLVLQLDRRLPPGECTTLRHVPSGVGLHFGFLPGDVTGDGTSSPLDILALVDQLNGVLDPPAQDWQCDINRSGLCEPQDLLTLIDLLNGAAAFDPWNGATLPACP
jgi:hypothetical protein